MQTGKRLTRKDYEVLENFAELAKAGNKEPLKNAIIAAYNYSLDDKGLASKVSNRKRNLCQTKRVNEIFEMAGIDKLKIATKLAELMEARNPVLFHGEIKKDEEGEPITTPDLRIQLGATTLAANIAGITQKQKTTDISRQINNLFVYVEDEKSARERVDRDDAEKEVLKESYSVEESLDEQDSD